MNNYVGIDFSMNSTGVCIESDGTNRFYNFRRTNLLVRTQEVYDNADVHIIDMGRVSINSIDNYSDREFLKLKEAHSIANTIIGVIPEGSCVALEGLSYGGRGTRMLDIAGFQYVLRYLLYQQSKVLKFYPPTTVKKFVLKGNASKEDMVNEFIKIGLLDDISDNLLDKDLYSSPFTDFADAYFIKELLKTETL